MIILSSNIIDDSASVAQLTGNAGWAPRDWSVDPLAGGPFARAYDGPRLGSDEERKDLIRQKEKNHETNIELARDYGFTPYHRGSTNFCWANATTMLVEFLRCRQGLGRVPLSAASVACVVTEFRNVGGWCKQALDIIAKQGAVPQEEWPANAIDRRLNTAKTVASRKKYRVTEYDDIEPRDSRLLIDYLILCGPVATARMFWRHATLAMDAVILKDGSIGTIEYNSGYGRDNNGLTILAGSRVTPDECVGIRSVTA